MTTAIIIPARYGSSRYRGKPLVKILGKEMVIRVADICSKIKNVNVYVATDSKKIAKVVKKYGYNYIYTSSSCLTGTDRVAEASKKIRSKIFINVQGDEPTINPSDIKNQLNSKDLKKPGGWRVVQRELEEKRALEQITNGINNLLNKTLKPLKKTNYKLI